SAPGETVKPATETARTDASGSGQSISKEEYQSLKAEHEKLKREFEALKAQVQESLKREAPQRAETNKATGQIDKAKESDEVKSQTKQSAQSPAEEWTAPARAIRKDNPVPADQNSVTRGRNLYVRECLICHGPAGKGDGP